MQSDCEFRQLDQATERTLVSHAENLKASLERGECLRCGSGYLVEINPRNIIFRCHEAGCGWHAVYPIRTIGNSERANQDESLDLIAIAEKDVIEKARTWGKWVVTYWETPERTTAEEELLSALVLLESREAMAEIMSEATETELPRCAWCDYAPDVNRNPERGEVTAVRCSNRACPVQSAGWLSVRSWSARAARPADEWQDISSAPKDGTCIILGKAGLVAAGYWDCEVEGEGGQCWRLDDPDMQRFEIVFETDPTHWQKFPDPPKDKP